MECRCIENDYLDIGHAPGPGVLVWIHNGKVRTLEASSCDHRCFDQSHGEYDGYGRVDTMRKVGSITFNFTTSTALLHDAKYSKRRRKARKIVQDVVEAFSGVKFRVFCGDSNTTVQESWEDTE